MTPQLVGLFTATPGALQTVMMPAATAVIVVRNDSPYDCWVKMGGNPPAAAPSLLNVSHYQFQVTPGQRALATPENFDGRIFVGIYNPGGKASSGTVSSRANVYVEAYPAGEGPGAGASYSALTGLDATSQQRVIAIPTEPHINGQFGVPVPTFGSFNTGIFLTTGQTFSGSQPVTCYLYGLDIGIEGFAYCDLQLTWRELDGGGLPIAGHVFGQMVLEAGRSRSLFLQSALPTRFTPLANCVTIGFAITPNAAFPSLNATAGTGVVVGTILADIDLTGQPPPPAIGNGAATPPGAIY